MGKRKTLAVKQKETSPATSRTYAKKVSPCHTDLTREFIQSAIPGEPDSTVVSSSSQSLQMQDKFDLILTLLQTLGGSYQVLIKRVSDLEAQKSVNSIARNPQLQPDVGNLTVQNNMPLLTSTVHSVTQLMGLDDQVNTMQEEAPLLTQPAEQHAVLFSSNYILPNISILRRNQSSHSRWPSAGFL